MYPIYKQNCQVPVLQYLQHDQIGRKVRKRVIVILRMAENVWEVVDVFDGAFQGLYLGERLSSLSVIWRQVVPKLVQGLRQAPHAQFLPFAGLHAPLGGHLWLALPLPCDSGSSSRVAKRKLLLLGPTGAEHLRWWAAQRLHGGVWRTCLFFSERIGFHFPLAHYLRCNNIHIHVGESEVSASDIQVSDQSDVQTLEFVFLYRTVSGGLLLHSWGGKKFKEKV